MIKKSLYPLTDWRCIFIPLGAVALSACAFAVMMATFGSAWYHGAFESQVEMNPAEGSPLAIMGLFFAVAYLLVIFAMAGYAVRVARQAGTEEPYRLPAWSRLGKLFWEGFLAFFAFAIQQQVLTWICMVPLLLGVGGIGGLSAVLFSKGYNVFGVLAGISSLGVFAIGGMILWFVLMLWWTQIAPLMVARFAYTGKFRSLFSPRWAIRAILARPWDYLLRCSAWNAALLLLIILTPLTWGGAYFIAIPLLPLTAINTMYLVGDYYHHHLADEIG